MVVDTGILISITVRKNGVVEGLIGEPFGADEAVAASLLGTFVPRLKGVKWERVEDGCAFAGRFASVAWPVPRVASKVPRKGKRGSKGRGRAV